MARLGVHTKSATMHHNNARVDDVILFFLRVRVRQETPRSRYLVALLIVNRAK